MPIIHAKLADVHLPDDLARDIDRGHVARLAETKRSGGYLPPPLAVKNAKGYQIASGAHRFLAHVEAGAETIAIEVPEKPLTVGEIKLDQWRENQHRLGFALPDQAALMLDLMREYDWTQEELAERLEISPGQVCKTLQVSKNLAPDLQEKIVSGALSPRSAYPLAKLPDHAMQREVFGMGLMKCALVEREVTRRLRQLGLAKREKRVKAVTGRTRNGTTYSFRADLDTVIADLTTLLEAARKCQKLGLPPESINPLLNGG